MLDGRIKTYLLVVKKGSFTQAAKAEYRSTVAIMNQISSLENELGVKLLIRSHRGVTPTEAGKKLYNGAQKLSENAAKLVKTVQQIDHPTQRIIRVGTSLLRPSDPLIKLWLSNTNKQNNFELQLVPFIDHFEKDEDQILTDKVDCIVTPYGITQWTTDYNYLPLGLSDCHIGVTKGNPLYQHRQLSWSDLEDQKLFLLKEGKSLVVDQIRKRIKQSHPAIEIHDLPQLYDINALNQVIRAKGLVELPSFWANVHPEIKSLPMDWSYQISYGLLYHKHPSNVMQEFINRISAMIED